MRTLADEVAGSGQTSVCALCCHSQNYRRSQLQVSSSARAGGSNRDRRQHPPGSRHRNQAPPGVVAAARGRRRLPHHRHRDLHVLSVQGLRESLHDQHRRRRSRRRHVELSRAFDECLRLKDHVAFYTDRVDLEIDGKVGDRPGLDVGTPF